MSALGALEPPRRRPRTQGPELRAQNSGPRTQGPELRTQNSGPRTQDPELRPQNLRAIANDRQWANDDPQLLPQAALASAPLHSAKAQSSQGVSAARSEASTVEPHQMRRQGGASRWPAMSRAAFSLSSSASSFFTKARCSSSGSRTTAGSVILRHTEVLDRVAGSTARFSSQGVRSAQSKSTRALALVRA